MPIGICGLAGFVVGVIVAWQTKSSTAILIVSAILLVLAALGLDWDEIRGTYGGATLQLLRGGLQKVGEQIDRVAADEEVPAAVREELESLREQVNALTPPARPRSGPKPPQPSSGEMDALIREMYTTRATHSFRGLEAVELSLRISTSSDARYHCTVKTPTEAAYSAVTRRQLNIGVIGPSMFKVTYPDEFQGAEPLTPGRYEVEWRSAPLVDPVGANVLALTLAQTMSLPAAVDSFTIPDRAAASVETPPAEGA